MYRNDSIPTTYRVIFSLLKHVLAGIPFQIPPQEEIDWDAVWTELQHHSIHLLVAEALMDVNPENRIRYLQAAYQGTMKYHRLMQEQQAAGSLLCDAGIPFVILKGASACRYYKVPSSRCMGDVDILVTPQDYPKAKELLCASGTFLSENFRHCTVKCNGVLFELHKFFSAFEVENHREALDEYIFQAFSRLETVSQEQYTFPSLPTLENGLVLLTHISHYLEGGLGLRQFIDWMLFVEKHLDNTYWEETFGPAAKQIGLETLAITVTKMCQLYLGSRQDITWCCSAPDVLCKELMSHTIEQGNFGRKLPKNFNSATHLLRVSKNPLELFAALQYYGSVNWKAVKRYPFLKHIAWLYQIWKYIKKLFHTKRPLRFLIRAFRKKEEAGTLAEKAGVTTVSKREMNTDKFSF